MFMEVSMKVFSYEIAGVSKNNAHGWEGYGEIDGYSCTFPWSRNWYNMSELGITYLKDSLIPKPLTEALWPTNSTSRNLS